MAVKLWIDELRKAPAGWEWAQNITQAIKCLDTKEISEVSMDYDISLLISIGVGAQQEVHSGETFESVARFIYQAFDEGSFPVEIHSLNPKGQKLLKELLPGWKVTIKPAPQGDRKSPEQPIVPNDQNILGT